MRYPKYELTVEYSSGNGYWSIYEASEDLKTDVLLLAAKMIGFYQGRGSKIHLVRVVDTKTNTAIELPKGLLCLY